MQTNFDNTLPQYSVEVSRNQNGQPEIVIVEPILRGGSNVSQDRVFFSIGDTLRSAVFEALNSWRTGIRPSRVVGILQMKNLGDYKHAHTMNVKASDINYDYIREIFDRATTGYMNDLTIYDVNFSYWINPTSFTTGAGNGSMTWAERTRGIFSKTYKVPDGPLKLNCAASAISYIMSSSRNGNLRLNAPWYKKTLRFMKDLGWGTEDISIAQLEDVVEHFKDHRIVCINYITKNGSTDYKGEDYIFNGSEKIIYLYYCYKLQHFYGVSSAREFIRGVKGNNTDWCHKCATFYRISCACSGDEEHEEMECIKFCGLCGTSYSGRHQCHMSKCEVCRMTRSPGHRCTIFNNLPIIQKRFNGEVIDYEDMVTRDKSKKPAYNLIAYDIESSLEFTEKKIPSYQTDSECLFPREHQVIMIDQAKQVPNLVVWKNVFTGEGGYYYDIKEFVQYMINSNDGFNICVAHNSKGYDGRLIFDALCKINSKLEYKPLMRGTQIIQLKCGPTVFRDSMLHMPGSLGSLAEACLKKSGIDLEKGEFPHFFNRADKYDYTGPLPDDIYYDLKFTLKNDEGKSKHERFRAKWEGRTDWNAHRMLLEYCQNDVEILAELMKYHHFNCKNAIRQYEPRIAISPWFSVTSAGYVHRITLLEQALNNEENEDVSNEWVSLDPVEHYFAKKALRGGRTEVRKFYHKAVDGEKIKCIDVHSMYPSIQIGKAIEVDGKEYPLLFPVGAPVIDVFDSNYYPCTGQHFTNPSKPCRCTLNYKKQMLHKNVEVVEKYGEIDLHEYIRNFDGIIMVDATPPKMYHPILPVFNEETKKCVFSCEPIICKTFASPQLKLAIDHGYKVTKIYRADRYRMAESKWRGLLGNMYLLKYYASSDGTKTMPGETVEEMRERHVNYYLEKFDLDLDFNRCRKDPAMKQTGKILINSAWGKHAESIDHDMAKIIDEEDDNGSNLFYTRINNKEVNIKEYMKIGDRTMFKYNETRNDESKSKPNLHKQYLPAAVFVPMYGQMMVWNMLNKVGEAALMCDTDSVKYVESSSMASNPITAGDCLGDWEDEGNLEEFVSIGLKSYALRYEGKSHQWNSSNIKLKGCCIKRSHQNLINFDIMKEALDNEHVAYLPQLSFDYTMGEGIMTREFLKKVKFDPSILKGEYDKDTYKLYPFGYFA